MLKKDLNKSTTKDCDSQFVIKRSNKIETKDSRKNLKKKNGKR